MNNWRRVGDRIEPCGTTLLIGLDELGLDEQWPSTTATVELSKRKLQMKKQRRIETERGKFRNQNFVPNSINSF